MILNLKKISAPQRQQLLQYVVAPRPICLASTINEKGQVNLSPFSFFGLFSASPPIVIFSAALRMRDGSSKHTLKNVQEVPEVVIHIVEKENLEQMNLSSAEFPKNINEFIKAGFTADPATIVRPPMVRECRIKMECQVNEIKMLGQEGGAGNLIICEVLMIHMDDQIIDSKGMIRQQNIRHIARLGKNWYCQVSDENLFEVDKPSAELPVGVDGLPTAIRESRFLSGANLAQLAAVHKLPRIDHSRTVNEEIHRLAKRLLDGGDTKLAWDLFAGEKQN